MSVIQSIFEEILKLYFFLLICHVFFKYITRPTRRRSASGSAEDGLDVEPRSERRRIGSK